MQSLHDFHGSDTINAALRWARIRLAARPETRAWADEIEAMRQKVGAAADAHDNAVDERASSTQVITALDTEVDDAVARIARKVKDLCDGKLDDPRYVKLFCTPASEGMTPIGGDAQTLYVTTLLQAIAADPAYAEVAPSAKTAEERLNDLLVADAGRDKQYAAEGVASANLKAACDQARRLYNALPARLELLFGDRPVFIDSFFRKLAKSQKAEKTAEPEATV